MEAVLGALQGLNQGIGGSRLSWALATIVVNLGARFVTGELTPMQQSLLRNRLVKRVVLVAIFFLPTRDLLLSVCLAFVTSLLLEGLLNETSPYCLLPASVLRSLPLAHRAPVLGLHALATGPGHGHGHGHGLDAAPGASSGTGGAGAANAATGTAGAGAANAAPGDGLEHFLPLPHAPAGGT